MPAAQAIAWGTARTNTSSPLMGDYDSALTLRARAVDQLVSFGCACALLLDVHCRADGSNGDTRASRRGVVDPP